MDQGQQLAARMGGVGTLTQAAQLISQLLDAESLRQQGRQQQPGVGDRLAIGEGDGEPVGAVGGPYRESALSMGPMDA
jgi:hypothetical protein